MCRDHFAECVVDAKHARSPTTNVKDIAITVGSRLGVPSGVNRFASFSLVFVIAVPVRTVYESNSDVGCCNLLSEVDCIIGLTTSLSSRFPELENHYAAVRRTLSILAAHD